MGVRLPPLPSAPYRTISLSLNHSPSFSYSLTPLPCPSLLFLSFFPLTLLLTFLLSPCLSSIPLHTNNPPRQPLLFSSTPQPLFAPLSTPFPILFPLTPYLTLRFSENVKRAVSLIHLPLPYTFPSPTPSLHKFPSSSYPLPVYRSSFYPLTHLPNNTVFHHNNTVFSVTFSLRF